MQVVSQHDLVAITRPERGLVEGTVRWTGLNELSLAVNSEEVALWLSPGVEVELHCFGEGGNAAAFGTLVLSVNKTGGEVVLRMPDGVTSTNQRSEPRIMTTRRLNWAVLDGVGNLGPPHGAMTRDVSLGGIAFETVIEPPPIGSLVALAGNDQEFAGTSIAIVRGVDDRPVSQLKHIVRCAWRLMSDDTRARLESAIEKGVAVQSVAGSPQPPESIADRRIQLDELRK